MNPAERGGDRINKGPARERRREEGRETEGSMKRGSRERRRERNDGRAQRFSSPDHPTSERALPAPPLFLTVACREMEPNVVWKSEFKHEKCKMNDLLITWWYRCV